MKLADLIRTPPPVHAFAAAEDELTYARLNSRRDALARVERLPLQPGWFKLGPVGLLQVDRQALSAAVSAAVGRLEKAPDEAGFVAPNAWFRSVVIDAGELPRQREEAEQVVRWRLKKLLPCRPEEVRVDYVAGGERGRMLVVLGLDRPLVSVEEAFAAAGVALGRIEPAALALTALLPASSGPLLLAALEDRALALVVLAGGQPILLRHKPLPADPQRADQFVVRELGRTLSHARDQEGLAGPVDVWVAAGSGDHADAIDRWAGGEAGVTVNTLAVGAGRVPAAGGADDLRLWSLLGSAWAGAA